MKCPLRSASAHSGPWASFDTDSVTRPDSWHWFSTAFSLQRVNWLRGRSSGPSEAYTFTTIHIPIPCLLSRLLNTDTSTIEGTLHSIHPYLNLLPWMTSLTSASIASSLTLIDSLTLCSRIISELSFKSCKQFHINSCSYSFILSPAMLSIFFLKRAAFLCRSTS